MLNKEDINLFNIKMREYSVLNYQVLEKYGRLGKSCGL